MTPDFSIYIQVASGCSMEISTVFEWRPDLSVGNHDMDDHHQRIHFLCRCLLVILNESPIRKSNCIGALGALIPLVEEHYAAEEKILEKNGYPHLAAHASEHRHYVEKLGKFLRDAERACLDTEELRGFLYTWSTHHFFEMDLSARRYFIEH